MMSEQIDFSFEVYPNPFHSSIAFQVTSESTAQVSISITDVLGRTLLQLNINPNVRIEITPELPPGCTYFINVSQENNNRIIKLVKD